MNDLSALQQKILDFLDEHDCADFMMEKEYQN